MVTQGCGALFVLQKLPWSDCGHSWNTALCKDDSTNTSAFPDNTNFTNPVTEYWE